MTNGSIAITRGLFERAQLQEHVDSMMDITQPKAWKPSPAAYHFAVKELNLKPEQVHAFFDLLVCPAPYLSVPLLLELHSVHSM